VSSRTSNGFTITSFVGWLARDPDDGSIDGQFNTSIFPDYTSFVVFK
jgi:hypothetical protein